MGWIIPPSGLSLWATGHSPCGPDCQEEPLCRDFPGSIVCCWGCYGDASWMVTQEAALTSPWEGSSVPWALAAFQVRQAGDRAHMFLAKDGNQRGFRGQTYLGGQEEKRPGFQAPGWGRGGPEAPITEPILPYCSGR